jgi:hypothetical protein
MESNVSAAPPSGPSKVVFIALYVLIGLSLLQIISSLTYVLNPKPTGDITHQHAWVALCVIVILFLLFLAYKLYTRARIGWILGAFCSTLWGTYQLLMVCTLYRYYQVELAIVEKWPTSKGPVYFNFGRALSDEIYWLIICIPFTILIWRPSVRLAFHISPGLRTKLLIVCLAISMVLIVSSLYFMFNLKGIGA